jgi:hypothetical protein
VLVKPQSWERHGLKSWIEASKKRLHHNVLAIALAKGDRFAALRMSVPDPATRDVIRPEDLVWVAKIAYFPQIGK